MFKDLLDDLTLQQYYHLVSWLGQMHYVPTRANIKAWRRIYGLDTHEV